MVLSVISDSLKKEAGTVSCLLFFCLNFGCGFGIVKQLIKNI